MGAAQNVLAHTVHSNGVTAESLAMSGSRIRDADLAKEVAQMERWKLLCQSSISILSEANKVS